VDTQLLEQVKHLSSTITAAIGSGAAADREVDQSLPTLKPNPTEAQKLRSSAAVDDGNSDIGSAAITSRSRRG
jgi:hypothetical protein